MKYVKNLKVAQIYAQALIKVANSNLVKAHETLLSLLKEVESHQSVKQIIYFDVFTIKEKQDVLNFILDKINAEVFFKLFINELILRKRLTILNDIELLLQEEISHQQDITAIEVFGAYRELSEHDKSKLVDLSKKTFNLNHQQQIKFLYQQNADLKCGYRLIYNHKLVDLSLDHQLNRFVETMH